MKTHLNDIIRNIIKEELEAIKNSVINVGEIRGSSKTGFNFRLSKNWKPGSSNVLWSKLRSVLVGYNLHQEPWRQRDEDVAFYDKNYETFIIVDLDAINVDDAELERQAFIGDLESKGIEVYTNDNIQQKVSNHPYR